VQFFVLSSTNPLTELFVKLAKAFAFGGSSYVSLAASIAATLAALFSSAAFAAASGDLDSSFAGIGNTYEAPLDTNGGASILSDQANRTVMLYTSANVGSATTDQYNVVRYTTTGAYDTTFGGTGTVSLPLPSAMTCSPELTEDYKGNLLIASCDEKNVYIWRLKSSGSLDPGYGAGGIATISVGLVSFPVIGLTSYKGRALIAMSTDTAGVGGLPSSFTLVRATASGLADTSLVGTGVARYSFFPGVTAATNRATDVKVDASGRILIGGRVRKGAGSQYEFALARVDWAGTLDGTFGSGGMTNFPVLAGRNLGRRIALDSYGRVVMTGSVCDLPAPVTGNINCYVGLARVKANGALDTTLAGGFGTIAYGGSAINSQRKFCTDATYSFGIATFKDRILITGYCDLNPFAATPTYPLSYRAFVMRLDDAGNYDPSFGPGGSGFNLFDFGGYPEAFSFAIAIDKNGQNLIAGNVGKTVSDTEAYGAAVAARVLQ
jgi:uncharacterized delta-60 repeat protein